MALNPISLSLIGCAFCIFLMIVAWVIARYLDFYSLVDAVWAYGIAICAAAYAFTADGWPPRRILTAGLALVWGLRLGTYLALRLKLRFPAEDERYEKFRSDWKTQLSFKTFIFFQFQAVSQPLLAYPFAASSLDKTTYFHWNEFSAIVIAAVGLTGEALSDYQLSCFKKILQISARCATWVCGDTLDTPIISLNGLSGVVSPSGRSAPLGDCSLSHAPRLCWCFFSLLPEFPWQKGNP